MPVINTGMDLSKSELSDARLRYRQQRYQAKKRSIQFLLSFNDWLSWWLNTGHWHERGRKRGQYVMARFGDVGPYSLDNITCITRTENLRDAHLGTKRTEETKAKIAASVKAKRAAEDPSKRNATLEAKRLTGWRPGPGGNRCKKPTEETRQDSLTLSEVDLS